MHRRWGRSAGLTIGATALALSLSSCGGGSSPTALPKVTGAFGVTPRITFPSSGAPSGLKVKVLKRGTGPVVKAGELLIANYVGQIWRGKVFDSSFARHEPSAFPIGEGKVILGWDKTLVGVRAGSRLLLVIPPSDGYGPKGNTSAGISGSDTLAFVVDVIASYPATAEGQRATRTLSTEVDGVKVTWTPTAPPVVHLASGSAVPKKVSVVVLSRGSGHVVTPGLVVLQYVVVDPKTGKVLESTWQSKLPDAETVASSSVLGKLLGLRVGTRLLLRLPKTSSGGPYDIVMDVVAEPGNT